MENSSCTPVFQFTGCQYWFPDKIHYRFKVLTISNQWIYVCPYSLDGGKTFRYRISTEDKEDMLPPFIEQPQDPVAFETGLRQIRIRSVPNDEASPILSNHIDKMVEIYMGSLPS
jgi:hypothetical protein